MDPTRFLVRASLATRELSVRPKSTSVPVFRVETRGRAPICREGLLAPVYPATRAACVRQT